MGKTRDLCQKIRDTKMSCQDGHNKGQKRYGTEAEDIKKRWQENTELYKNNLHDPDKHDGMITNLEPHILECEVKRALESITMNKTIGGDGIPHQLFQILKDDSVKSTALNMPANLENSAVATRLEKVSFYSNPKER